MNMNLGGVAKRFTAAARGASTVVSNTVLLLDPCQVDEELWSLHGGDSEELDRRCAEVLAKHGDVSGGGGARGDDKDRLGASPSAGTTGTVPTTISTATGMAVRDCAGTVLIKTPDGVIAGLPSHYFTESFDPIQGLILEISKWDADAMNENFMNHIENQHTDKEMVIEKLSTLVQANYPQLMNQLVDLEKIGFDMTTALTQIINSRALLQHGHESLTVGSLLIVSLQKKIDNLVLLQDIARSLHAVRSVRQGLTENLFTGEVGQAAECAVYILRTIRKAEYEQFKAIADMDNSVHQQIYSIKQKADKALMRISRRKFDPVEYNKVIKSYVLLDHMVDTMEVQLQPHIGTVEYTDSAHNTDSQSIADQRQESLAFNESRSCLECLSNRILRYQLEDIEECLRNAVLEFIYAGYQYTARKQESERKNASTNAHANIGAGAYGGGGKPGVRMGFGLSSGCMAAVELEDHSLPELYGMLLEDMVVPCVVRSCELMAEIVHTHYLLSQWHNSPFDPQNDDATFLHRNRIDLTEIQGGPSSSKSGASTATPATTTITTTAPSGSSGSGSDSGIDSDFDDDLEVPSGASDAYVEEEKAVNPFDEFGLSAESTGEHQATTTTKLEPGVETSSTAASSRTRAFSFSTQSHLTTTKRRAITTSFVKHFDVKFESVSASMSEPDVSSADNSKKNNSNTNSSSRSSDDTKTRELYADKLILAYQGLVGSREALWGDIVHGLENVLNSVTVSSSIALDDFLDMNWAVHAMNVLGSEFCGSTTEKLRSCLDGKARQYYKHMHGESFFQLKKSIDTDAWVNVPLDLNVVASSSGIGIREIIKRSIVNDGGDRAGDASSKGLVRMTHDLSAFKAPSTGAIGDPVSAASTASSTATTKKLSILQFFNDHGNPLHFVNATGGNFSGGWDSDESDSDSDSDSDGSGSAGTDHTGSGSESGDGRHTHRRRSSGKLATPASTLTPTVAGAGAGEETKDGTVDSLKVPQTATAGAEVPKYLVELFSETVPLGESTASTSAPNSQKKRPKARELPVVVAQSAEQGLTHYTGRYLQMMHLLPSVATSIFQGLCQLYEFYLCCVFRGFIPEIEQGQFLDADSNKMTSSSPYQTQSYEALHAALERVLGDVMSYPKSVPSSAAGSGGLDDASEGAGAGAGGRLLNKPPLQDAADANTIIWETCQINSQIAVPTVVAACDASSFYALHARIVAAESCWFAALALQDIRPMLEKFLPPTYKQTCIDFVARYQQQASQLRAYVYRSLCPLLVNSKNMLAQIVDVGQWDLRRVRPVDPWVKQVVSNCAELWAYLSKVKPRSMTNSPSHEKTSGESSSANTNSNDGNCTTFSSEAFGEAAPVVREQVWLELCQTTFDIILDGYALIKSVSSEGRAQMLRDAEALQAGLDEIHPCMCPRGLPHVENYVRAATQAPEEMMLWVQDNYRAYAYRHMYGLVVQTFSSIMFKARLRDAVEFIDELYGVSSASAGASAGKGTGKAGQSSESNRGKSFNTLFDSPVKNRAMDKIGGMTIFKMGF